MKVLSKAQIFGKKDIEKQFVPCPEWAPDGDEAPQEWGVFVRGMSGQERDAYEASMVSQKKKSNALNLQDVRAKLLMICCVDDAGKDIFDETDLRSLTQKSAKPIDRLFAVAQTLSGISDKDIEELIQDFPKARS